MELIGHRGCARWVAENSLAGVHFSADTGLAAIECDVTVAADGVPVVFHDRSLNRMTGVSGDVTALSSDALATWPLRFQGALTDQRIPTAFDYFSAVAQRSLFLHLEIKDHEQNLERLVPPILDALSASTLSAEQVRVSSFSWRILEAVHALAPELSLGWASTVWSDNFRARLEQLPIDSVHLDHEAFTAGQAEELGALEKPVYVYTVNDPKEAMHLRSLQVAGVFTDDPVSLRGALRADTQPCKRIE